MPSGLPLRTSSATPRFLQKNRAKTTPAPHPHLAMNVDPDHDVTCLDDRIDRHPFGQLELVHSLVGDRGSERRTADIDANMGRGLAFFCLDDGSLELVAGTQIHQFSPVIPVR